MTQSTLVLIKPDGVGRGLIGEVVGRIERRGLRVTQMDLRRLSADTAEQHYAEHADKPFFGELVEFITSGPLVAMVVQGTDAVKVLRAMVGATNPVEAGPGTIRGDFATTIGENIVHASDSPESAEREVKIFFPA